MEKAQELEQRALTVPEQARQIVVVDNDSYIIAGELLLMIKALRFEIAETFDPIISKAHAAHAEAIAQKRKVEQPLAEAEKFLKPQLAKYDQDQENKRLAEEWRVQVELKKQEVDARLDGAIAAENAGDHKMAERILKAPVIAPAVVIEKTVPKIRGLSYRTDWKFRITDEAKIPRAYLMVDETKIGGVVRAMQDKTNIPGVEPYPEKVPVSGRKIG